jgi:hypothetical protein
MGEGKKDALSFTILLQPLWRCSQAFPLRDISNGGSGCAADTLLGDHCPNPAIAVFDNTCEVEMMCGTAKKTVFQNGGQRSRCAKMVGKNGFLTQAVGFFGVFLRHGMLKLPEYC